MPKPELLPQVVVYVITGGFLTTPVCATIHVNMKNFKAFSSPNFCNMKAFRHCAACNANWLTQDLYNNLLYNGSYIYIMQSKLISYWRRHSSRDTLFMIEWRKPKPLCASLSLFYDFYDIQKYYSIYFFYVYGQIKLFFCF